MSAAPLQVADRLIDAFSRYDAADLTELLHPEVRHWVNVSEHEHGFEGLLSHLEHEARVVVEARYTMRDRTVTAEGFVLQFVVDGRTRGGADFHVPACLVVALDGNGLITRIDEYADIQGARSLLQEMYSV